MVSTWVAMAFAARCMMRRACDRGSVLSGFLISPDVWLLGEHNEE